MKSIFPYQGKLNRKQIEFFAAVSIASFTDHIQTMIPGRWFGKPEDEEEWQKAQRDGMRPVENVPQMIDDAIDVLSWNLSILYAQATRDGMGCGDALEITDLGDKLRTWATEWFEGKIGITRYKTNPSTGQSNHPDVDVLARAWVKEAWDFWEQNVKKSN